MECLSRQPRTLTVDNGRESAGHQAIARQLQMAVYFSDFYSTWQRGAQ